MIAGTHFPVTLYRGMWANKRWRDKNPTLAAMVLCTAHDLYTSSITNQFGNLVQ